jgi:hypothetical protein
LSPEAARALRDFEDSRPELTLLVNRTDGPSEPRPERRTVVITGQRPMPRRREPVERVGPRPDRIAMWAFVLGIFLVIVATATADAAPL